MVIEDQELSALIRYHHTIPHVVQDRAQDCVLFPQLFSRARQVHSHVMQSAVQASDLVAAPIGAPSSLPLANRWVFSTSVARRPLIPRVNTKARATRAACARNLSYSRRQEFFRFVGHRFQALKSLEQ